MLPHWSRCAGQDLPELLPSPTREMGSPSLVCRRVRRQLLGWRLAEAFQRPALVEPIRKGSENFFNAFRPVLRAYQQGVASVDHDQIVDAQQGDLLGWVA
jgi:hypothetical protein